MNRTQLVEALTQARYHQLDCNTTFLAAQNRYIKDKAYAYLRHLVGKVGHFQAMNLAICDPKVNDSKELLDKAQLDSFRARIEVGRLQALLGIASDISDEEISED